MEWLVQIFDWLIVSCGYAVCGLIALVIVLFIVQLFYWLGGYARIAKFRNGEDKRMTREVDGISLIVLLGDDQWYLDTTLPKIMAQDYHNFELMIVSVGAGEDFKDQLEILKMRYPNLNSTHIEQDPKFPISNKMAYNVGIKGCSYEHVVLTTSDTTPVSNKWLSLMAKGFETGEVLIAYCGMERKKGFASAMIRSSRLMMSIRYLSAAIASNPYRGIVQNLGFTREIYFRNRGFDHLNMNLGEDDLFVRNIVSRNNISVVMNPHATVRQEQWGALDWWWNRRKFVGATYKYYPVSVKFKIGVELVSRLLLLLSIVAIAILTPWENKAWIVSLSVVVLWILRLIIVRYQVWRIRKRLGEGRLGAAMMLYDIISPFIEIVMAINRKISPAAGIWR